MTLRWADRVLDTSTTTGTGPFTVSGSPPLGSITFSQIPSIVVSDTFYACVADQAGPNWVVGLCTYRASNQITVTTPIINNSGTASTPNFTSGALNVYTDIPASIIAAAVLSNVSVNLTAGYSDSIYSIGTITSGTVTPAVSNGNEQGYTNNGAHSLVPPVVASGQRVRMCVTITNAGSAGAITLSGTNANGVAFDTNTSTTAAYATTNSKVFDAYIVAENAWASITIIGPR